MIEKSRFAVLLTLPLMLIGASCNDDTDADGDFDADDCRTECEETYASCTVDCDDADDECTLGCGTDQSDCETECD